MTGTLAFQAQVPFTLLNGTHTGTVTLNGTAPVAVATPAATASSLVLLTVQPGAPPAGLPVVASVTAGTGFSVKLTSAADTAVTVAWLVVTHA